MYDSPCGFDVPSGHRGRLPDGNWMLFPTRKEYEEYFQESVLEVSSANHFQNFLIYDKEKATSFSNTRRSSR